MTKQTFKLAEVLQLHQELVGNEQVQGLLGLPMTMLAKFRLGKLVGELAKEVEAYQKVNEELIKKYGEEKDGSFMIFNYVEDEKTKEKVLNPNLEKYSQEINPILQEEKELEIPEIKIRDFQDTKVEGYYPVFFSKGVVE